uniref:Uncharacterized protein n=1 Tax=Melanopsichium pennsylvanicum 4 TaxID=1398559 RepID=A0A077R0Z2_9BASI|nr:conserved hypothetical protein [Melanopsichium pennsylvanicum 4]
MALPLIRIPRSLGNTRARFPNSKNGARCNEQHHVGQEYAQKSGINFKIASQWSCPERIRIDPRSRKSDGFATRTNASGRTTVKDPEPQTGLYYHPTQISIYRGPNEPSSTADGWAISFLANPSSSEDAVIAYVLPTNTSSSQDSKPADFVRANPDRIHINPAGWKIMHDVLKNQVVPNDDLLNFEASTRESGWAHLTDLRHPLMPGRIATPENIIASVAFTEGKLNVESYEENKSYRLVTGYEGPIQMADGWLEKLRKRFGSL